MKSIRFAVFTFLCAVAFLAFELPAYAQATRTWVSGVGDDANPASRTAPALTLSGALPKTQAGGEIDSLDPGNFASVTISKAITIDGLGELASVVVTSGPAMVINAGQNDTVTIRNFSLDAVSTSSTNGTYGIYITSAGQVNLENCEIGGFTNAGIYFAPTNVPTSGTTRLFIHNCHIYNSAGPGIYISPVAGPASVVIEDSQISQCSLGVHVDTNSSVLIKNSSITLNQGVGVETIAGGTANILDSQINQNGSGITSAGTATISHSTITRNTGRGLSGSIMSYHNNIVTGNNPDGQPSAPLPYR